MRDPFFIVTVFKSVDRLQSHGSLAISHSQLRPGFISEAGSLKDFTPGAIMGPHKLLNGILNI